MIGALFEVAGLSVTGLALWDRSQRHNTPPGSLRRAVRWIDNRVQACFAKPREQFISLEPAHVRMTTGQVWPRARPGEIADGASVDDKVVWLIRYVGLLDGDIDTLIKERGNLADELRSELKATAADLEQQLARQRDEFTQEMVADLGAAWFGLAFAIVGVCLGFIGYWLG
jgi:hypothetical protein